MLFLIAAMYGLMPGNKIPGRCNSNASKTISHNSQKQINADTFSLKGNWDIQVVLLSDTAAGKTPTLFFDLSSGTFSGNTGCNTMRGSFRKTGMNLVFNQDIITTKMECTGYNEAAFIKSLLSTNHYKFDKGILVLMYDDTELSRWTRRPQKVIKMNKA
jgi:heat shock protein HslJ